MIAKDVRKLLPGLLLAAVVAFFAWKSATVRQVRYTRSFNPAMALAAMFVLVSAAKGRDRRMVMLYQLGSLYLGYQLLSEHFPKQRDHLVRERLTLNVARRQINALGHWGRTGEKRSTANLAALRLDGEFHDTIGDGTVEAVPWNIARVHANGWKWSPRPIFASYAILTPALDRLNAEHILSDRAAGHVLLEWGPIDRRHHFFADPMSWRALLNRYEVVLRGKDLALLKRRSAARFAKLEPFASATHTWGESITVPKEEGWIVMAALVEKSLMGSVRSILFRLEPVFIEVSYQSGRNRAWRAVAANLRHGAILNPLPSGIDQLARMFQPDDQPTFDRVTAVRLQTANPRQFASNIAVHWYRMVPQEAVRP